MADSKRFYAKKSAFGYTETDSSNATHIICEYQDFKNLLGIRDKYKADYERTDKLNKEKDKEIADLKAELSASKGDYSDEYDKNQIAEARIANLELQLTTARSLNKNLLRVMKERNNSKRGIKPKKTKSGYVIKSCKSFVDVEYEGKKRTTTNMWLSAIETPLSAILTVEQAKAQFEVDLKGNLVEIRPDGKYYADFWYKDYKKDLNSNLWTFYIETNYELEGIATDLGIDRQE